MLELGENCKLLRQAVIKSRPGVANHPDMDKLDRDVADSLNKWKHLTDEADNK